MEARKIGLKLLFFAFLLPVGLVIALANIALRWLGLLYFGVTLLVWGEGMREPVYNTLMKWSRLDEEKVQKVKERWNRMFKSDIEALFGFSKSK